ncbi:hypothetical protein [Pelagibius sp. Alg239-R121]|uniref:hypothetical protein n=1 Tax=Pelagibius sp. Alg239-R121 TaxID=2993448 RepID=UPI0024A6798A|nr:hypothetical protein [Pelagibius sp. Alg239-R121]
MTYQEKGIAIALSILVLMYGIYGVALYQMFQDGRFESSDATSLLGKSILALMAAVVVVTVAVRIGVTIFDAIAARDANPVIADERDKQIELRGLRISHFVFAAGFVLSMVALALGQSPFVVINLVIVSLGAGEVSGSLGQLYLYRRGV